jgi:hypothetical protein
MKLIQKNVHYFKANKTLESYVLINHNRNVKKVFWLYNYEGIHYRLFTDKKEVNNFLNADDFECMEFENERKCDDYFEKLIKTNK